MNMISLSEKTTKRIEFWIFFTILTLLSLFMILWCGPFSEYSGHDFYFHLRRFEVLIKALIEGNYPIYLDYETLEGYGYFTKAFYPDLVLLPFAFLGIFTGSMFAYYSMIFTFTFLCGLFMYYAINTIFKKPFVASVSSIIYTFSAYHILDWYHRAALAEAISFTFLPLIFLGMYYIIVGNYKKWYVLTIAYSLLIYTHLLSSVVTFMIIVIFLLICSKSLIKEPKRIFYLMLAATVTLFIVACYLFPMLEQMASNTFYYSINEDVTEVRRQRPAQIVWGMVSGIIYKDKWDMRNAPGIGLLPLLFLPMRLFIRQKTRHLKIADLCLVIGLFLFFMITDFFPWSLLPFSFIQFPWRLYEFVVFFLSIAGAYYLATVVKSYKYRVLAGTVILIITLIVINGVNNNYKHVQTLTKNHVSWHEFSKTPHLENQYHLGMFEYLPVKVSSLKFIRMRGNIVEASNEETEVSSFLKKDGYISFDVIINKKDVLELPFVYYKGYKATLDENNLPVSESPNGLVQIEVSESGLVEVCYEGTMIQRISWLISIISFIGLCIYIVIEKKKKYKAVNTI